MLTVIPVSHLLAAAAVVKVATSGGDFLTVISYDKVGIPIKPLLTTGGKH